MEIICRIIQQLPLQEREFNNQQTGQKEKFATMGFVLQSGNDRLYAEMIQEQARRQPTLDYNYIYKASLKLSERTWTDQQGQDRHETRITLMGIALM
jgi:hypothetical protein